MTGTPFDRCASCGHYRAEHHPNGGPCTCDVLVTLILQPSRWETCPCPHFKLEETTMTDQTEAAIDARIALAIAFRATADSDPIPLQIDDDGPVLTAPYVEEHQGLGYAWITPEQIPLAREILRPHSWILDVDDNGNPYVQDHEGEQWELAGTATGSRYALGPLRWTILEP